MKFTEEQTCKLMELYHEYDCLWNLGTIHYRNRNKRQAAEVEIVQRLGIAGFGVNELKQKIKNLRCTYNQECIEIQKSKKYGSGSTEVYVPNLKWFPVMDNIIKSAKGNKKTEDSVESVIQKTQNIEEKELEPIIDDPDSNLESTTQTQAQPIRDIFSVKRSASEKAKEKIKKRKIEHLADAVQNLRHVTESVYENENNTNEHDAFGNFVAASLKVLPTAKALLAQSEIQGILMKHRLSIISQENTWTQSTIVALQQPLIWCLSTKEVSLRK
ncbi:uncharacterized protein LOC124361198 [Homalodisca vitripennis]|uniref:uncharacterized protein LOC124361198 n=1 Tax=Homalodisca vitripennis TaxID=197043 RepID=UPI001EEBF5ED|nr:uncharacterized protein LOC124361198 [Homalodisca vitripennis]